MLGDFSISSDIKLLSCVFVWLFPAGSVLVLMFVLTHGHYDSTHIHSFGISDSSLVNEVITTKYWGNFGYGFLWSD